MAPDQRKIDEAYGVQHIDRAYVDGLARPLVRYQGEPPHDALTVLAIAVQAALYEALEMVELGNIGLRQYDERKEAGQPHSLAFASMQHGQVYAGTKVIRRVADALRLFQPGPNATPGERVLAARSRAGLGQSDLAAAAGVHRAHISHIERGRRALHRPVAEVLAGPLGVTPEYLLTGRDPDAP